MNYTNLAELPASFLADPPYTNEYVLACVKFPADVEDKLEALRAFASDTLRKNLLLNVEIKGSPSAVSIVDPVTKQDVAKVNYIFYCFCIYVLCSL